MNSNDLKYKEYARFLCGESTEKEIQDLLKRLENDSVESQSFEKLKSVWSNYSPKVDSSDKIWQKTSGKLGLGIRSQVKTRKINPIFRYAAVAILLVSIGINLYFLIGKWTGNSVEMIEYSAKKGEVKQFVLPDGSKVWLNSESTLILPEYFEGKTRNVFLIGEAFFKVEKNPKKPFLVNTSALKVKVLGTSFSVRDYQNDPEINTSLLEGKVELQSKGSKENTIVLKPSEEAIFKKSNGQITIGEKPNILIAPWREGSFRFYNTDLLSIAHQLERKFDCEFVFVDEAAESLRFTADFENENLEEILELLNKAHSFKLKKAGRRYMVSIL